MRCIICAKNAHTNLCDYHDIDYKWDSEIKGYRLKQRGRGSRYNTHKYHITETKLAKIIESLYGRSNVVVSYYPEWAISSKGVLYEYDILIKNKNIIIGYNGEQHYKFSTFFHKNKKSFQKLKSNDKIKRKLSDKNGYTFIEFGYKEPIIKDYVANKIERII